MADLGQAPPAPAHRHPSRPQALLHIAQACLQDLEVPLLVEAFCGIAVAPRWPLMLSDRGGEAPADGPHSCRQACRLCGEVALAKLPGVVRGAADRSGPAGRGVLGGCPFAPGTGLGPVRGPKPALPAPLGQVPSQERAEMCAQGDQYRLVGR